MREVPKLLSQSGIFLHLPNCEEGFGITIIEAMATGLICICGASGGYTRNYIKQKWMDYW